MRAWFRKDKWGGIFKPLIQWGKAKCQRENPSRRQLYSLSYSPNHLLLPEIGWGSYFPWDGKGMEVKIRIGQSTQFWENVFWLNGQGRTQKSITHPLCIHVLSSSCVFGSSKTFFIIHPPFMLGSHATEPSCVLSFTCSTVFLIFPCPGNQFLGCWVNGQ